MKLYFAGAEQRNQYKIISDAGIKANMLAAFSPSTSMLAHFKKDERCRFLDSGGFSAFTQGKQINIDEYISFISQTKDLWDVVAGLDIIGNAEASRKNLEYMESKGLNPLPTFHFNSPEKELRRLIKKYDYIALGGLVPIARQRSTMVKWLDYCFSIVKTETKVHGFGVNSVHIMKRYPFYSVDASSWLVHAQRLATVISFENGNLIAHEGFGKGDVSESRPDHVVKFKDSDQNPRYIERSVHNIKEYIKAAEYVTRLWAKRGVIWED